MGNWRVALGNVVARSRQVTAVAPSVSDALYPIAQVGLGQPDTAGRFAYTPASPYTLEVDANLLQQSSPRSDAPTGWADLNLHLAGTPGLPANAPSWGTFFGRRALEAFDAVYQDVFVLPGETFRIRTGIYFDSAGTSTSVTVFLIDLRTNRRYDASLVWTGTGVVGTTAVPDAWVDIDIVVNADAAVQDEPAMFRVILANGAGGTATSTFYVSDGDSGAGTGGPCLFPRVDFAALVGHNVAEDATVELLDSAASLLFAFPSIAQPSFFHQHGSLLDERLYQLRITLPAGGGTEPPYVGEFWLSQLVDMAWCPAFPFDITREDAGQVRQPGGYRRQSVFSDAARDLGVFEMSFEADDAGYQQARHYLQDGTRHGADPLLLLPVDLMEGAEAIYHGRLRDGVQYSRINNLRRRYTLVLDEDPFPRI